MPETYAVKRRFPRIPSQNALLVRKLGPRQVEGFAKTRVVGLGGCMFESDERLGEGSHLDLLMSVRGRIVRARARVVYELHRAQDRVEVGVEFVDLPEHDRAVIASLFPGGLHRRRGGSPS